MTTEGKSSETREGRWAWPLPFGLRSVQEGRRRVAAALRTEGVQAGVVDDACSVVSELLANAIRHGRPRADGTVVVTLGVDPVTVTLAVGDGGGSTMPSVVDPLPLAKNGRGLGIVHTLTSDWGVREDEHGNTVFGILNRV